MTSTLLPIILVIEPIKGKLAEDRLPHFFTKLINMFQTALNLTLYWTSVK